MIAFNLHYLRETAVETAKPADVNINIDLARLFTSMSNADVTFVVSGKEFLANKTILVAQSPVFAAMFQHGMKEAALNRVNIVDIPPDVFRPFFASFTSTRST